MVWDVGKFWPIIYSSDLVNNILTNSLHTQIQNIFFFCFLPCKGRNINHCRGVSGRYFELAFFTRQQGTCFFLRSAPLPFSSWICPTPPKWLMVHPYMYSNIMIWGLRKNWSLLKYCCLHCPSSTMYTPLYTIKNSDLNRPCFAWHPHCWLILRSTNMSHRAWR